MPYLLKAFTSLFHLRLTQRYSIAGFEYHEPSPTHSPITINPPFFQSHPLNALKSSTSDRLANKNAQSAIQTLHKTFDSAETMHLPACLDRSKNLMACSKGIRVKRRFSHAKARLESGARRRGSLVDSERFGVRYAYRV